MPECSYCGDSFDGEDEYLDHLASHEGELSAIDRRRVANHDTGDDGGLPTGPAILAGVVGFAVVVVVYVTVFMNSGATAGGGSVAPADAAQQPGPLRSAHEHGTINVTIDGQTLDFSQEEYQLAADKFHFEGGTDVWHKHATGVTVEWAMATLGIGVSEDSVTFEGTTYHEGDPNTTVSVRVNGEPVDPTTYVLQGGPDSNPEQGDHLRIVVRTDA
jgi:hypothetical protein